MKPAEYSELKPDKSFMATILFLLYIAVAVLSIFVQYSLMSTVSDADRSHMTTQSWATIVVTLGVSLLGAVFIVMISRLLARNWRRAIYQTSIAILSLWVLSSPIGPIGIVSLVILS